MTHLAEILRTRVQGDLLFDRFSRGRYATDASLYQMMPLGILSPKSEDDIAAALDVAREQGVSILSRGGGTSQCGQTVNEALVLDNSQYFNGILQLDLENMRCVVRPGIVLDELNRALKSHGLWFPVDVSTASRATIGGMAGNLVQHGFLFTPDKAKPDFKKVSPLSGFQRMVLFSSTIRSLAAVLRTNQLSSG